MENLLLKVWEEEGGKPYRTNGTRMVDVRTSVAEKYAWAVPNQEALDEIASHQPLFEMGAGEGYWARLLQDMDVDIEPFDLHPPEDWELSWANVFQAWENPPFLPKDKTLFMCWVPQDTAAEIARLYEGNTIIWVGEEINFSEFEVKKEIEIPQWDGYEDSLSVFNR